jgi:hypothetical protein
MSRPSMFDAEFLARPCELARSSSKPRLQVAADRGVSDATLYKWMAKSKQYQAVPLSTYYSHQGTSTDTYATNTACCPNAGKSAYRTFGQSFTPPAIPHDLQNANAVSKWISNTPSCFQHEAPECSEDQSTTPTSRTHQQQPR